MKKQLLLLMITLLSTLTASAYVEIDGIFYNLDANTLEATVTKGNTYYKGDVTIPKKVKYNDETYDVTSIGNNAFSDCSSLKSVTIPNSVISIGNRAFYRCVMLTSVTIGNSVDIIGEYAFAYCYTLPYVTIPNSVTTIEARVFYMCSALRSVEIGNSVYSIGDYAFGYCSALLEVFCYAKYVPTTGYGVFYAVTLSIATLHVPEESLSRYGIDPWNFGSIVPIYDPSGIETLKSSQQNADGKYMKNGKLIIMKNGKKYDAAGRYYE